MGIAQHDIHAVSVIQLNLVLYQIDGFYAGLVFVTVKYIRTANSVSEANMKMQYLPNSSRNSSHRLHQAICHFPSTKTNLHRTE